jgi:hypothetical protein
VAGKLRESPCIYVAKKIREFKLITNYLTMQAENNPNKLHLLIL